MPVRISVCLLECLVCGVVTPLAIELPFEALILCGETFQSRREASRF